jgi:serine/threonine-protein kinase
MHPAPVPNRIRAQLDRILRNRTFSQSERMRRFLCFAVEHCLSGRPEQLKEYLIGVEVFDKKPDYDPRLDPIVRVEARRLRAKLKEYYENDGGQDEIVIDFPKGSYAPQFRERRAPAPAAQVEQRMDAVVILPFSNLGSAPEDEYFADGLAEELIHGLTRIPGLRVVAWNSAAQLRDQQHDLAAIGGRLKAAAALTGSVRHAGQRLRVSVQLVETASGVYLWSETYDRELRDVFAIQEEISRAIVTALRPKLAARLDTGARHATSVEAHSLYLQGRYHWNKRTPDGLQRSVQLFEQCVALDGDFALGYSGLADAFTLMADYGLSHPREMIPKAKSAALRAIELDPRLGEAWASLALIRGLNEWEWEEAGRDYERAFRFNPGYASAHHWYSVDYLAMRGRFEEALAHIEIASQLDPLSAIIVEGKGYLRLLRREYDAAMPYYRESLELDPFFYKAFSAVGRTYIQQERYGDAIEVLHRASALAPRIPNIMAALGQAHALAGDRDEAIRILDELTEIAKQRYVTAACFAIVHLGLGEKARALDWLEAGAIDRETPLAALAVHPVYDPLRSEPRFKALLRRVGLAA